MADTPYEVITEAIQRCWGRGSVQSQQSRIASEILAGLYEGKFLKIESLRDTSLRQRGRPRVIPSELRARIQRDWSEGLSFNEIAKRLNSEGVPAATGRWHHSSVARIAREPLSDRTGRTETAEQGSGHRIPPSGP